MNRTKIGWVKNNDGTQGYSWNPLQGRCPNACPYCYANAMRKRFKMYDGPLKLDEVELRRPLKRKKPCTIFVCSMNELFGPWIPDKWIAEILGITAIATQHRYLFLTKFGKRLCHLAWEGERWTGLTITGAEEPEEVMPRPLLWDFPRFISFEPLLGPATWILDWFALNWLIIGSLNKSGRPVPPDKGGTRVEWVWPILERADKLGIPVFLKKELLRLYPELPERREVPWIKN